MAAITVAQLIKELMSVPNHDSLVLLTTASGTNLVTVNKASATNATPKSEGPESNNRTPAPGSITLTGGA